MTVIWQSPGWDWWRLYSKERGGGTHSSVERSFKASVQHDLCSLLWRSSIGRTKNIEIIAALYRLVVHAPTLYKGEHCGNFLGSDLPLPSAWSQTIIETNLPFSFRLNMLCRQMRSVHDKPEVSNGSAWLRIRTVESRHLGKGVCTCVRCVARWFCWRLLLVFDVPDVDAVFVVFLLFDSAVKVCTFSRRCCLLFIRWSYLTLVSISFYVPIPESAMASRRTTSFLTISVHCHFGRHCCWTVFGVTVLAMDATCWVVIFGRPFGHIWPVSKPGCYGSEGFYLLITVLYSNLQSMLCGDICFFLFQIGFLVACLLLSWIPVEARRLSVMRGSIRVESL